MNIPLLESRVRSLEEMMADLIATAAQTSIEMREFKEEMKDFKDEMRGFKDEMSGFKDGVESFKDEMRGFKDEMSGFKDGIESFKDEMRREHRQLNKQLGEIANKQGRMTEDLVAPSICRILQEVVDCPPSYGCGLVVRIRRVHPDDRSRTKEFDAIAECGDYVLVNETKSKLAPADIGELMDTIKDVREYFPEYKNRKFIGSLATLYVDDSLVKHASRKGLIVLAVGDELMDVMNEPGFKPTVF
jgi:predicted RNase H-like nuclease (RuvC/YqgF family)